MRSKLFVPCSRPELFGKALAGGADAVSFDLEDAVPEAGKAAARQALSDLLRSDDARRSTKTIIVRVNAPTSGHFAADISALTDCRVDLVNLPKAEQAPDIHDAVAALQAAAVTSDLLVNIETASGLANAAVIARAHPRVAGLQVGLNDLFASLGIDRADQRHAHAALWSIRIASGAADRFAYDGAWPDLADDDGFRREAELARSLGYRGKSCIHPRQVPIANAVFDADAERHAARRLLAAAAVAESEGRGAFLLDGKMIDRPAIERARALLDSAS